jgi:hypothetical protein
MNRYEVGNHSTKICQSYIVAGLYKKGFLKSKAFTFTNNTEDLQNKLHHIIKSSVNKEIDKDFREVFTEVRFSRWQGLRVSLLLTNQYGKWAMFKARSKAILDNAAIGLSGVMKLTLNGNLLSYAFDGLSSSINPSQYSNSTTLINIRETLDNVISCIMYIPSSIAEFGNLAKEINKIDINYNYSIKDIRDIFNSCHIHSTSQRGPLTNLQLSLNTFIGNDLDGLEDRLGTIVDIEPKYKDLFVQMEGMSYYPSPGLVELLEYLNVTIGRLNGHP